MDAIKLKISRYLSYILRHKPEVIGITLDAHGWVYVDELIIGMSKSPYPISKEYLKEIVATDDKQRYSFDESGTKIRANQGHSINVDLELEAVEPPEYLWHGTGMKYLDSIRSVGIIPKSRMYVHISASKNVARSVGERHGEAVILRVRSGEMYRNGYDFYLSSNGVWLTKNVPAEYIDDTF